jgi:glutamine synthetase
MVHAGLDGVARQMHIERESSRPLPGSLSQALDLLEATPEAEVWLGEKLLAAYVAFKRAEIEALEGLDEHEICRRYADVY